MFGDLEVLVWPSQVYPLFFLFLSFPSDVMLRKTLFYCEIIELLTACSIIARVLNAVGLYLRIEWKRASNICPKYLAGHIIIKYTMYPCLKAIFPCSNIGIITVSQDSCLSLMNGNYTPEAPYSAIWIITNFFPPVGCYHLTFAHLHDAIILWGGKIAQRHSKTYTRLLSGSRKPGIKLWYFEYEMSPQRITNLEGSGNAKGEGSYLRK